MSVVWMHADGDVVAVAGFYERGIAEAYASYSNRRHPTRWFEVRTERADGHRRTVA